MGLIDFFAKKIIANYSKKMAFSHYRNYNNNQKNAKSCKILRKIVEKIIAKRKKICFYS